MSKKRVSRESNEGLELHDIRLREYLEQVEYANKQYAQLMKRLRAPLTPQEEEKIRLKGIRLEEENNSDNDNGSWEGLTNADMPLYYKNNRLKTLRRKRKGDTPYETEYKNWLKSKPAGGRCSKRKLTRTKRRKRRY